MREVLQLYSLLLRLLLGASRILALLHDRFVPADRVRMACIHDLLFCGLAKELRSDVVATFLRALLFFHGNAVGVSPCVLTRAGDLPGNFCTGLSTRNSEVVPG